MAITAKFTADFNDFQKETKKAETGLTEFEQAAGRVARNVATDLLAMFSIQKAAAFVSDIIASAGALKDLSAQTQISTTDLQVMAAAMSEFGVNQDELGRGLVTLSKRIAGGDDSVAGALARMGLALEDVAGLTGQDLFLKIEKGLASLKGSLRDTTAAALFGDKLGAAMAGASEGIEGAIATARELNTVMSEEAIAALDQYSESIARTKTNIANMTANAIGPLAEGFNNLVDAMNRGTSAWELFAGLLPKGFAGIGTGIEGLSKAMSGIGDQMVRNTEAAARQNAAAAAGHGQVAAALTEEQRATEFLRILQQNAAKELTATQIKHLEQLKEIGQLNAANAAGVGVTAAEYQKYLALLDQEKAKLREIEELNRQIAAAMKAHWDGVGAVVDQVLGVDALQAATTWQDAIEALGGSVANLRANELEQLKATMLAGIDALARMGQLTNEQSSHFASLAVAADQALAALRPQVTVTEDLSKAMWDYVRALDAEAAAQRTAGEAAAAKEAGDAARAAARQGKTDKIRELGEAFRGTFKGGNIGPTGIPTHGGRVLDIFGKPVTTPGTMINLPKFETGFEQRIPFTNIVINGSVLGNKDEIARVVGDAITHSYSAGGLRMPT